MSIRSLSLAAVVSLSLLAACGDDGHGHDPGEVISRVVLTFTPMGGGAATTATFDDPDGDGGDPPTVDPVNLAGSTTYTLTVQFLNALEDPPEDITVEVRDEGEDHQVFFTGTAVDGPASDQPQAPLTHSYADQDAGGLPLGLTNTIVTDAGTGTLTVTLRHLPPLNDQPQKTASTAADVKAGGFAAIGGDNDANVDFAVTAGSPTPP